MVHESGKGLYTQETHTNKQLYLIFHANRDFANQLSVVVVVLSCIAPC